MLNLHLDRKLFDSKFQPSHVAHMFALDSRSLTGPLRTRPAHGGVRPARSPPRRKQPKTAEELDLELDAFMVDADTASTSGNDSLAVAVGSDGTAAVLGSGDVEMA